MKTKLLQLVSITLILLFSANVFAQTDGTLTFTFNRGPAPYTGLTAFDVPATVPLTYNNTTPATTTVRGNALLEAVWIEDANGVFVKTFIRYCAGEGDHLPIWTVASGGYKLGDIVPPATIASTKYYAMNANCNVLGAVTGATRYADLTAAGALVSPSILTTVDNWNTQTTITWDGRDTAGNLMPDGVYKLRIEAAWMHKDTYDNLATTKNTHGELVDFTFNKGPVDETLTPADNGNIKTITTTWTAKVLGVDSFAKNSKVSIYPNPSNGVFNIDFNNVEVEQINIVNVLGQTVFSKKVDNTISNSNISIDISNNPNGVYIVNASNGKETKSYKVILNK